jgi:N-methylhydantoinase A
VGRRGGREAAGEHMAGAGGYRVGADIGGTFTDIVLAAPDGACRLKKVLSTPDDYARGVVAGLRALLDEQQLAGTAVAEIVHGTTVATNAILENRVAPAALLTTRGFRDVLELRRLRVPHLYHLRYTPPRPLVERWLRLEVAERLDATGAVVEPLDEASVRAAVERIRRAGVAAVAVCLLHSYRNPVHERRVGEIVREALPGVFLSLSVDVLPEIREYERTSTTVINAVLGPVVGAYLAALTGRLRAAEIAAPVLIMQSNGGIMPAAAAAERPARIVESGPAAGVIAAQQAGRQAGVPDLISFDMGGTTAKASLIEGGRLGHTTEYEVGAGISLSSRLIKGGGHALKLPVLDIAEVGAGGGSIVWLDRGGALKVGPHSAGAAPGPACYGRGGAEPTITDANVVLGYINPRVVAGGAVPIDAGRAAAALARVAGPLGLALAAAAYGVYTLANASMIRAIKAVTTYRGRDPRDFALLAFGGSGPVHAAAMARLLGIRRVVVPPAPGLFSAVGLLQAVHEQDFVQTFFAPLAGLAPAALTSAFAALEARARAALAAEGLGGAAVVCDRLADLRYVGQAYELTVPAPAGALGPADLTALAARFGQEHERTYGHRADDEPVELVNLRVVARVAGGARPPLRLPAGAAAGAGERLAYFGPPDGWRPAPVLARADLAATPRPGPLIVEEYDATTVVPPGCAAWRDQWENIVIEVGG